jgi:hypothetical protein
MIVVGVIVKSISPENMIAGFITIIAWVAFITIYALRTPNLRDINKAELQMGLLFHPGILLIVGLALLIERLEKPK